MRLTRPRCAVLVQVDNRRVKTLVIASLADIDGETSESTFIAFSFASRPSFCQRLVVFSLSPFPNGPHPNHQLELFVVELCPAALPTAVAEQNVTSSFAIPI
ncbi:hypothetical protein TYRP_009932 [Tyrophagus putrescentiae]|nr:hypothetical protein TYRP_009932 [Tyrophagus putrescentiae]